jgi:hypothetical protein
VPDERQATPGIPPRNNELREHGRESTPLGITYVPLLAEQRELYRRPRDFKRFKAYLHMTIDFETNRVRLPTLGMNSMAKGHVGAFVDALISLDADGVGEAAAREAEPALRDVPGSYLVALVVCDDVAGGWTNRDSCEYSERLAARRPPARATSTGSPGRCGRASPRRSGWSASRC